MIIIPKILISTKKMFENYQNRGQSTEEIKEEGEKQ